MCSEQIDHKTIRVEVGRYCVVVWARDGDAWPPGALTQVCTSS